MKEKIWTLWIYLTIGLFALGIAIIYGVARSSKFNIYIFGVGILLLIPGIISIIIEIIDFGPKTKKMNLKDLKFSGIKIPVDLSKCKIITNEWTITKPEKNNTTIIFNELTDNSYENRPIADAVLSRVTYSCVVNGKKRTFRSPTISRDKLTLKLLLETQKETGIYIDRDDPRYYYFDLEFTKDRRH